MSKHPQQITTADTALDDDMKSRIIRYSITMGIRTFSFVAAYFMFRADLTVLMWICVAAAVLLPYPAVIVANAGRERTRNDESALLDGAPMPELPPAAGETIAGDTISGDLDDSGTTEDTASADDAPSASNTAPAGDTDQSAEQNRGEDS
ncbi:MAG: DUF3099 domain-containing protein [Brevibacterium sp.]|uniref:DUF3099 domain-containing protein n=1 Tax=Brevibacterium sp. TaxID=1701 RepID=UPI0026484BD3|nr:DUF3099 domain-containing protein [Brevibacterium sp.]MDN5805591.1 DUF3099 domain-containing protein [Brevibacterium sp.]MDN5832360.1 DUF3099 domain-containing protein [Brevibacterium sp.]MDN5877570.1 DUF3099 domain-containing protein [Brevibacterium sp.]MDN5908336.1 DUF3099 domain-containing protein [Brevibacterium sp.]MDN6123653.1 DUF3099 domain-containing protein [Brevibacterium sp.]